MGKSFLAPIFFAFLLWSCQSAKKNTSPPEYLRWVGDIEHDVQSDDSNFKTCHGEENVFQYFNLGRGPVYAGEKKQILSTFKAKYKPIPGKNESGLIRIRFVVNCEGKAGRFRLLQSDYDYQEKVFDKRISHQLLEITKSIERWEILYENESAADYYMYLIFKLKDGHITEILP